ncbi:restriction endonuclease subunit S [Escherichia coli]|uniref:restriction endonuclease subunit S n=1 Tax=Escherichia coli TaxID=562 RepID=UPI000CF45529|nr:restriction endonuclease subunit S [Escherichia coli]PQK42262.1 restriction endonuclease subunit S [Escherichia coli]
MTNFSGEPISSKTANAACGGPQGGGMDSRRNGVAEISPKYLAEVASNAIPSGYKQTEVGVIPEDWEILSLGQSIAKTQLGGNYKNSEHDTGQPLIKMGNLGRGFVKLSKQEFVIGNASESELLNYGDVLFNTRNTLELVGKVAIWKNELPKAYFNSNLMRISFKEDLVSSNLFMNALMNSEGFIKALSDIAIGTTSVAAIYNRDLFLIKVALPTKKEQTAIANALSDVDALISEQEKLIAKKQAIKTATMQQLLTGRTRLPQFALRDDGSLKGTKPSELGEIPEDWDVFLLLDIANLVHGKAHEPYVVESGKYVVVNSKFVSTEGKVRKYCSQNDCAAKRGDILMVLSDLPNGKALAKCFYVDQDDVYAVNQRVCIFRTSVFDSKYLQLILNRHKYFLALDDGVTQTHILNGDIAACQLFTPVDREEQTAIATILSDMDEEIQALEQRLDKTRQIKQGMMQELLTGKTRLPIT